MKAFAAVVVVGFMLCCAVTTAQAAGKDYHDQDLTGKDFSSASLNEANFSGATLTNAIFTDASLKEAKFNGANVQNASFNKADLTGADLRETAGVPNLEGATLTKAKLQGLVYKGFSLGDCKCRGANFAKAEISTSIYRCDFREADFRGANLRGSTIDTRGVIQWKGAIYNSDTSFPDGFDPKAAGMVIGPALEEPKEKAAPAPSPAPERAIEKLPPAVAVPVPAVVAPPAVAVAPVAVVADPAPEPAPAPLTAEKGDVQLSGLYLQITSLAIGGRMQMSNRHYYFLPDGHVFFGIPPGGTVKASPTAADVAVLEKASAKSLGVYKVSGDQLTIQYPGGEPKTDKSSIQKNGDLGTIVVSGAWAVRQRQFKDKQTLAGQYATTANLNSGGDESHGGGDAISVSSLNALDFHADGTFTGAGAVSLGVSSKQSNTGDSTTSGDHGRYELSGNTLAMTHADGKTELLTAYPIPDGEESPPRHLNISGVIYTLEK